MWGTLDGMCAHNYFDFHTEGHFLCYGPEGFVLGHFLSLWLQYCIVCHAIWVVLNKRGGLVAASILPEVVQPLGRVYAQPLRGNLLTAAALTVAANFFGDNQVFDDVMTPNPSRYEGVPSVFPLTGVGAPGLDRAAFTVNETCRLLSIGRTRFYALVKAGELRTVKIGRKTLVLAKDMRRLLDNLEAMERRGNA